MSELFSRRRGFYRARGGRGTSDRGDIEGDDGEQDENEGEAGGRGRGVRRYRPRYVRRGGPRKPTLSGNPNEEDDEHHDDQELVSPCSF